MRLKCAAFMCVILKLASMIRTLINLRYDSSKDEIHGLYNIEIDNSVSLKKLPNNEKNILWPYKKYSLEYKA